MSKAFIKFIYSKLKFIVTILFFIVVIIYYNTKQNIDLNGLWKNNENASITKITQEGDKVTFTHYQSDTNWKWPGQVGDITVESTLKDRKLTGKILIVPERGYCAGYSWWHDFTATISDGGKTINEVFKTNIYDKETCKESGEYPLKTKTLIKI